MAAKEALFCDPSYFGQLRKQSEDSLLEVKKRAAAFLPHVLHVDIILRTKVPPSTRQSQRADTADTVCELAKQMTKLKGEVSGMLQELILAEAAIVSMASIAQGTSNAGQIRDQSQKTVAVVAKVVEPPVTSRDVGGTPSRQGNLPGRTVHTATALSVEGASTPGSSGGESPDEGWGSSFGMSSDPLEVNLGSTPCGGGGENSTGPAPEVTFSPHSGKVGAGRRRLPVMSCKVCGVQFKYKLSLYKHFKEHSDLSIAAHNYHNYIQYLPASGTTTATGAAAKPGSKRIAGKLIALQALAHESTGPAPSLLDDQSFHCVVCGKVFNRPNKLVRHMQIHDPDRPRVECTHCNRSFTRYDTMYYHIRTQHPEVKAGHGFAETPDKFTRKRVDGGSTAYRCRECRGLFTLLTSFQAHDCAGAQEAPHPMVRCIHCNQAFDTFDQLAEHQIQVHAFCCKTCSKTFLHEAYLRAHLVIHSGPGGKFTCQQPECGAAFAEHDQYLKHIKTHPHYCPYRCPSCQRAFAYPSLMVAHSQSCARGSSSAAKLALLEDEDDEEDDEEVMEEEEEEEEEGGSVAMETTLINTAHSLITNIGHMLPPLSSNETFTLTIPVAPELTAMASSATSKSLATLPTSNQTDPVMEPLVGLSATSSLPRANLPTH